MMKVTVTHDAEHSPIPELNAAVKHLIELYEKLGPLETKLAIIEHEIEPLREVFNSHDFYTKLNHGTAKLGEWLQHHLPHDFPAIHSVDIDEDEVVDEFVTDSKSHYPKWHEYAGHPMHKHPNAHLRITVEFNAGAVHSGTEADKFCETHVKPWLHKHGMTEVELDGEGEFVDGRAYCEMVIYIFGLDVELK
jgi:hypothetical protein